MPECEHCHRDVKKLLAHPFKGEKVCLKCMTRTGFFTKEYSHEIEIYANEKRANIRVPISISMSFGVFDVEKKTEINYPAFSVDLTTEGICFAWEHCKFCLGYEESAVHPKCFFYPYSMYAYKVEEERDLTLNLTITDEYVLEIPCRVVYTLKESEMDVEYVGVKFSEISQEKKIIIDMLIHKYGRL